METGHCYVQRVFDFDHVPGGCEWHEARIASGVAANGLLAGAGDSPDLEIFKVYHPDCVVLGIGDVEAGPVKGGALGVVEGGLGGRAVLQTAFTASYDGLDLAVYVGPDDPVVIGIGDEQAALRGQIPCRGRRGDAPTPIRSRV